MPIDDHLGAAVRNGTTLEEVYGRAVTASTYNAAMARSRVAEAASTSVQLAMRSAATGAMAGSSRIVGYRRVLTGVSCAFCAAASTRRYSRSDLLPLHRNCDCAVSPIIGNSDPGAVINSDLLDRMQDASHNPDYWNARHFIVTDAGRIVPPEVKVVDHGELGPTLVAAGHHFTAA